VRHNVRLARALVGPGVAVAAVVKANAYGHGAVPVARAAVEAGAAALAVASAQEGVELREAGLTAPILVIGASFPWDAEALVAHDLAASLSPPAMLDALRAEARRQGKRPRVHVMVDLAMRRDGVTREEAGGLFRRLAEGDELELEGIASHFATADAEDTSVAEAQVEAFRAVVAEAEALGLRPRWRHLANTAGILRLPGSHCNMVRAGILLYGMASAPRLDGLADWRPVLSWHARVICLRPLAAGEPVGYGHTYVAPHATTLATLAVGYDDGYVRAYSNRAHVLIRGQRAPVVGRVSMDYATVDVGHIPGVALGDVATLIGADGSERVRAEELAELRQTIPYEVTCAIGNRVRRISDF
jgi:alanine racemase